jgi:hypothetical protein
MRRFLLCALLGAALALPATAQQIPEPELYELLPADYPDPILRICYTSEGICSIPFYIRPGTPCECRRSDGEWVKGVCTH